MRHLIDIKDLKLEEIDELIDVAKDIINRREKYSHKCDGKKLATLFFEPSTRTRLSFEAAMMELGGKVLGFSESSSSSVSKGETVSDTIKVVGCYADIIVMRHPKEGAPLVASEESVVPIINAGDGSHNHPTQTLTDLLTIKCEKNRLDNLVIGICGDLKYGRTVHSLITAMSRYNNVKFVLISPKELKLPEYLKKNILEKNKIEFYETDNIEENIEKLDILYMTRVQQERFENKEEYLRLKDFYILDSKKMEKAKKDLCIMHPLPRVNEIHKDIDMDERACYFKQAEYGKYIRMALILKLIEDNNDTRYIGKKVSKRDESQNKLQEKTLNNKKCDNPRCITNQEKSLNHIFIYDKETCKYCCKYCETIIN